MGGIQAPKKSLNCKLFGWLLKHTKAVYARDEDSVHALEKLGYKGAEFFMDTSRFAYDRRTVEKDSPSDKKIALINLNKNGEKFYPNLLAECKSLLQEGYELAYVPVSK